MKIIFILLFMSRSIYSMGLPKSSLNKCDSKEIINILPKELAIRIKTIHSVINNITMEIKINPCLILSMVWAESTFKPLQKSFKGAEGLMQLLPSTRKAMVLKMGYNLNKLMSLNISSKLGYKEIEDIILGTFYMRKLLKRFKGNVSHAVIAYNQGPTRIKSQLHKGIELETGYLNKVNNNLLLITINN